MTTLEIARAKLQAGNFDLTPEEMTALAIASAETNPVMVPVTKDMSAHEVFMLEKDRAARPMPGDRLVNSLVDRELSVLKSKMLDALADEVLAIVRGGIDGNLAKAMILNLFKDREVSIAITKVWNDEAAYEAVKFGGNP